MRISGTKEECLAALAAIKASEVISAAYVHVDEHERAWQESHTPHGGHEQITDRKEKVAAHVAALHVITTGGEIVFPHLGAREEDVKKHLPGATRVASVQG